jgi:hypothetical protein
MHTCVSYVSGPIIILRSVFPFYPYRYDLTLTDSIPQMALIVEKVCGDSV